MTKPTTTAALLYRVSTERQKEKYSLPAQKRILTKYAKDQGWQISEYDEGAVSGTKLVNRPVMLQLLKDVEAGLIDMILVIEIERLTRDTEGFDRALIFKTFRDHNIRIATPHQIYDLSDVDQEFQVDLNAILSKREILKLRDRCRRGIMQAKLSGRWLGGIPPTGYRYNQQTRQLEHDGFFAGVVKKIFQLARDHSINKILTHLHQRRTPTLRSGKWDSTRIRRILHNIFYTGQIRVQDKIVKGLHQAIIDQDLYNQVQRSIRARVHHDFNTAPGSLLTGILFCGSCMSRFATCVCRKQRKTKRDYEKRYYRCRGRNTGLCRRKLMPQEQLDGIVIARVQKVIGNTKVIEDVYRKALEEDPDRARLDELARDHKQLRDRKENLLKVVEHGAFDLNDISRRSAQINAEMRIIEQELDAINKREQAQISFAEISEIITNFQQSFSGLDLLSRRELLLNILDKVVVNEKNISLYFKFPVHAGGNKVRAEL